MSSSHHDEHHHDEKKPVAFTVPFILAAATVLIILMFLSLCDPKAGHHGEGACHECTESGAKECTHHHGGHSGAAMHGEHHKMSCDACKSGCSEECMEACMKGDHSKHPEMASGEKHSMNCGECKSDCSESCMDSCMKGDHSKHGATAVPVDSTKGLEAAHAH